MTAKSFEDLFRDELKAYIVREINSAQVCVFVYYTNTLLLCIYTTTIYLHIVYYYYVYYYVYILLLYTCI